jgi:hypothetical protein
MLAAQQGPQGALAGFDRLATQILAVEFEQIECAEDYTGRVSLAADQVEYGKPLLVAGDGFAVDYAGTRGQGSDRGSSQRESASEIVTLAGEEADPIPLAPRYDAEAVMLDLMNPVRPCRRLIGRARKAWLNDAG